MVDESGLTQNFKPDIQSYLEHAQNQDFKSSNSFVDKLFVEHIAPFLFVNNLYCEEHPEKLINQKCLILDTLNGEMA